MLFVVLLCLLLTAFDCDGEWLLFRERFATNAKRGYPIDEKLVEFAASLVNMEKLPTLMMESFSRCNYPCTDCDRPCLYGVVAALWLIVRHDPGQCHLLDVAKSLLGWNMRGCMDFMRSFGWPMSMVDVVAQGDCSHFRLPSDMPHLEPPPQTTHPAKRSAPHAVKLRVWEIGVHASLSAEPLNVWQTYLADIEFRHLIRDQYPPWLPDKCGTLYSNMHCDDVEDEITHFFRAVFPGSATSRDPIMNLPDVREEFFALAAHRADDVDLFLCTVPYLCLLRISTLPAVGYFGHPMVFLTPTHEWPALWHAFDTMENMAFAVSDPFLQMQYEYQYGRIVPFIHALAPYTHSTYFPQRNEVLVVDRPHECLLMCALQYFLDPAFVDRHRKDDRLTEAFGPTYKWKFTTRSRTDRSFRTFSTFHAVALWPYDMDLITFYEFYSMQMPIFMPSNLEKYIFQQGHMDYDGRYRDIAPSLWPLDGISPFNETNVDAIPHIVRFADYWRFPSVQYFDSIPNLLEKLLTFDAHQVTSSMRAFNARLTVDSVNAWRSLLKNAHVKL